jgi:hypothetical protein
MSIDREKAIAIVHNAGLPTPPRSMCWFCPFTSRGEWIDRKMTDPAMFERAVQFENELNAKYRQITLIAGGSKSVSIHRDGNGLQSVPPQLSMFDQFEDATESCDTGYCGL